MLLTVSKRLEFSASRRLRVDGWSNEENRAAFGPETNARYGSGRNYVAYFVFSGLVCRLPYPDGRLSAVMHPLAATNPRDALVDRRDPNIEPDLTISPGKPGPDSPPRE